MKKINGLTIHRKLYLLVFFCWILPLGIAVLWFATQQEESARLRTEDAVVASVDYAMSEMRRRLEDALADSRSASYDRAIEEGYQQYLRSENEAQLYSTTAGYLSTQYGYNSLFDGALVSYWEVEGLSVLSTRTGLQNKTSRTREIVSAVDALVEAAADIGTAALFYQLDGSLYLVRNLVDSHYVPYATLILAFQMEDLLESGSAILWAESVAFSIDDIYLPVVGDPQPLDQLDIIYGEDDHFSLGLENSLESIQLRLEVTAYGDLVQTEREGLYQSLLTIVVLSGLLFMVIIRYVYYNIGRPMNRLLQGSHHLTQGDLGYQISPMPRGQEFYQLSQHFNDLSLQLAQQFDRHTQEQQALADARIKALQSQINPHFLNNTLEMINWQARMSGDDKVCQMIASLSVMLNAAMARGGSATVTMEEEFSYIEAYLYITSHRFGSRLQVKMDIDAGVWTAVLPRLILQPIVENAIEHGVAQRTSGELVLHIYESAGNLVIDVEHAGVISPQDQATIERLLSWDGGENGQEGSGRIGIRNVQYRLKMLYGERGDLSITAYEPGRVRSRIVLPLETVAVESQEK